jgi:hypothetical protein
VTSQAEEAAKWKARGEGLELLDKYPNIFTFETGESQEHLSFPKDFAPCTTDSGSAQQSGGNHTAIKWIADARTFCETNKQTKQVPSDEDLLRL